MLSKQDLELRVRLWTDTLASIKQFFDDRGYLKVKVPLIVHSPGMEPNLDPIGVDVRLIASPSWEEREKGGVMSATGGVITMRGGLITSPEYSMKKLLGAGLEKIYTITSVFRNVEKMGERWSVEFTMMEWYRQGQNYDACMQETQALVNWILDGSEASHVWPRISYVTDFATRFGIHPDQATMSQLLELCGTHRVNAAATEPEHELIDRLYNSVAMPELIAKHDRFFVCEYPVACASLSQKSADGSYAERFEGHVKGLEICNGFTELVDPSEQRKRFEMEAEERRLAGKEVFPIDEQLLSGLASIASPSYGNALGIDRLIMLKAGVKDIDSIHIFPPSRRFN